MSGGTTGGGDDICAKTVEATNDTSLEDLGADNEPEQSRDPLQGLGVGQGASGRLACSETVTSSGNACPRREVIDRPPDVDCVLEQVDETNDGRNPHSPTPETSSVTHRDGCGFRE